MLDKIKAAIFDMDGTLVDSLGLWDVLWEKFGVKYLGDGSFRPSAESDKAVRTMTLKAAMELIHREYNLGESGQELLDVANDMMEKFYRYDVKLKAGVSEFLDACHKKGIRMCIASATAPALLNIAIESCGIGKYFEEIFSCGAIGKGKDQPDIYLMAAEFLGASDDETCVFEDSLVAITTADKIGLKTVAIYDKYNFGQAEMKEIATEYIADGETLLKLVK